MLLGLQFIWTNNIKLKSSLKRMFWVIGLPPCVNVICQGFGAVQVSVHCKLGGQKCRWNLPFSCGRQLLAMCSTDLPFQKAGGSCLFTSVSVMLVCSQLSEKRARSRGTHPVFIFIYAITSCWLLYYSWWCYFLLFLDETSVMEVTDGVGSISGFTQIHAGRFISGVEIFTQYHGCKNQDLGSLN